MDNDKIEHSSIFIEMDCLFDTRLCVLASMGDDVLGNAIDKIYYTRLIDRFKNIDNKLYETNYNNRDKSVLKYANLTLISDTIIEFVNKTIELTNTSPFHFKPKVIVNIYPYILTEEESNNIIIGIINLTNQKSDVELVNMSYEDITPEYIKNNITSIVMYRYDIWLEKHSENKLLTKTTCPDVELLGPAIYFKPLEDRNINPYDAFKSLEELVAPFIGLKLLPIKYFCIKIQP